MMNENKIESLRKELIDLYNLHKEKLLFHGWHHIHFVSKKSIEFAKEIGADTFLVESAALTHDLNYIVEKNSHANAGENLRNEILSKCGYDKDQMKIIGEIINGAHLADRGVDVTKEVAALSDADTLFKALPITSILFAGSYITENDVDIYKLSKKIIEEQKPLMDQEIYFYTDLAKEKYLKWAKDNLTLWENVQESLLDEDVNELLKLAKENGAL